MMKSHAYYSFGKRKTVIASTVIFMVLLAIPLFAQVPAGSTSSDMKTDVYRLRPSRVRQGMEQVVIAITPDSSKNDRVAYVGDTIRFLLTALDSAGSVIRDWDQTGETVLVEIMGSTANTDSGRQSWRADAPAYTWVQLVDANGVPFSQVTANVYDVPSTAFADGVAGISFVDSKAEKGVSLVSKANGSTRSRTSVSMNFLPGRIAQFLVDVTFQGRDDNQVFLERPYEIMVFPMDRFTNVLDTTVEIRFSARYAKEFDSTSYDYTDLFLRGRTMTGSTNYFLVSTVPRIQGNDELQSIICRVKDSDIIQGRSVPFEILPHPPNPFWLLVPVCWTIRPMSSPTELVQFEWHRADPPDPFTDIRLSRFSPAAYSDDIRYTVVFADSATITRRMLIPSDDQGRAVTCTLTNLRLDEIMKTITGIPFTRSANLVWWVEATDGISIRLSNPPESDPNGRPGYYLYLMEIGDVVINGYQDAGFSLSQPYPNPLTHADGVMHIDFELPRSSHAIVAVYDLLGQEVARPIDAQLPRGRNAVSLRVRDIPPGVYLYRLMTPAWTAEKRFTVLR